MKNEFENFVQNLPKTFNSNAFLNAMKQENNWKRTENGAVAKKSTDSKLYDMFALGGSYRSRSEEDCRLLFMNAYMENPKYALKCLWYIRDIMEGQGERRFFRVCLKWLANYDKNAVIRNIDSIASDGFGRWDDLFVLFDTPCETAMFNTISVQLMNDIKAYNNAPNNAVSLLAKWMPSINASNSTTKQYARRFAAHLRLNQRNYRQMLSALRERIHVVERLMSQNRWDEIQFDKLPSRAGLIYRNCFKNKGLIAEKYKEFAQSDEKVNAKALFPYDVVREAIKLMGNNYYSHHVSYDNTERLMINKYWDNIPNVFPNNEDFNAMVVCDTSSSMLSGASNTAAPIEVAVSLAMYAAEKAKGPFKNHYISFSRKARLVEVEGIDFCDKVSRIVNSNVCENTNLESVFDLVLTTAMRNNIPAAAMPKSLIVVSDMEVDIACGSNYSFKNITFLDKMKQNWYNRCNGRYAFPSLYFWNVSAHNDTFLSDPTTGVTFLSGASPVLYEQVVRGLSGQDLMFQKLNSSRYKEIN